MKVSRQKAIKVIISLADQDGWDDLMDQFGLYDEKKDEMASIYDLFSALSVSEEEVNKAMNQ